MAKKLFGTDGIRGVAGKGPLAPERVLRLGRALARVLGRRKDSAVVCRDTRRSGPLVRDALVAGLLAEGIDVIDAGVRPTPALPYLAKAWGCAFGLVISASHNPMEYNGVKVFGPDGAKISDAREEDVERAVETGVEEKTGDRIGRSFPPPAGPDPYRQALAEVVGEIPGARQHRILLDCANGATTLDAPAILEPLGFRIFALHASPDGDNINRNCGALHPEGLARAVVEKGGFAGVALDGDGDRALLVDEQGVVRDGDFILASLATRLKAQWKLPGDTVVGTVMSNIGLALALEREGMRLHRTAVGDRHVAAAMVENGWALGGEPSGHIIFRGPEGLFPGDGILTALKVLEAAVASGAPLSALAGSWRVYPQVLLNVPVSQKRPFEEVPGFSDRLAHIQGELGGEGRIVLRYSGTEPVARVMVEGPDAVRVERYAQDLADLLAGALGTNPGTT
ncbi:MAG: phosphoglucosamine mutase [Planctomycetota bacterium]|jgi:phosphoglucosamine mutase